MKNLFVLIGLIGFLNVAMASAVIDCGPKLVRVYMPGQGVSCVPRYQGESDPFCSAWQSPMFPNPFQGFPAPLYQPQVQPWWAYQGSLYYPNVKYPGPWQYPGIQSEYYPGQGEVFAAKPNVYIESVHGLKKFNFKFTSETKPHFLVTTPVLEKNLTWSGKIVENDKFEVDEVRYDYLFYDVRLPKDKMQFTHGVCATREASIEWMMNDLKEMKYSAISLQDFEEHWRVKIPDYPFYCIYPQYNRDLDPALPIEIDVEQSTFIRSLYVLVPHKVEPDVDAPQEIPFPTKDPGEFRPVTKIQRENMFREWGVAFLGY